MSDYFAPMEADRSGQLRLAGGDSRLWVQFERKSRRNAYRSEIEGRPIYEPVDYVKIQQPGERDQWVGPVTEQHKQRFPQQYAQFIANNEQTPDGTPVSLLFPNEPHIVELCLDLRIQTVEQLGNLTEQAIDRLGMDGRKYVAKAQAALDKSEAVREVTRLEHELNGARDEIDVLKTAVEQQSARMAALERLLEETRRLPQLVPLGAPEPVPMVAFNSRTPPPPERPDRPSLVP